MIYILFIIITLKSLIDLSINILAMIIPLLGFTAIIMAITSKTQIPKKILLIYGIFLGVFPWLKIIVPEIIKNKIYLLNFSIGISSIIILLIIYIKMPKRTKYGNEIYGKIKGFKRFLETAEKLELEELIEKILNIFII